MSSKAFTSISFDARHLFDDKKDELSKQIHDLQLNYHCFRRSTAGIFLRVFPLPIFNQIQYLVCSMFAVNQPMEIPIGERIHARELFDDLMSAYLKHFKYECVHGNVR